jgi:hypothetical protein
MVRYEVERSANGINFEKIGSTNAMGNSNNEVAYAYTDKQPFIHLAYYRVKAIGISDTRYSAVVKVRSLSDKMSVSIFPNPVTDKINIQIGEEIRGLYYIKVIDAKGAVVLEMSDRNIANKLIQLNTEKLVRGLYYLEITNSTGQKTGSKFVK